MSEVKTAVAAPEDDSTVDAVLIGKDDSVEHVAMPRGDCPRMWFIPVYPLNELWDKPTLSDPVFTTRRFAFVGRADDETVIYYEV